MVDNNGGRAAGGHMARGKRRRRREEEVEVEGRTVRRRKEGRSIQAQHVLNDIWIITASYKCPVRSDVHKTIVDSLYSKSCCNPKHHLQ